MSEIPSAEEIFSDCSEAIARHYAELEKNRSEVMSQVAQLVSPRKLASINEFINEIAGDEGVHKFELTETHSGKKQEESGTAFRYIYIDHRSGGCPSGDDYYGDIWIPLPQGKYLKFSY